MKFTQNKAFTLVELLVVITILAIISVVAYQNFGSAVGKAVSGRKMSDVSTIESSLAQYKVDKNQYPPVGAQSADNLWGYNESVDADPSNQLDLTYTGDEISSVNAGTQGGGKVYGTGAWARLGATPRQIGAKGTIAQAQLGKQYLTKDLYDPEVGDLVETTNNKKLIEYGVGRYTYAVYRKPKGTQWGAGNNYAGSYYNIAYTVKKEGTDTYVTKIVGDYDDQSCFDNSALCLPSLIGNIGEILVDGQEQGKDSNGNDLSNFDSTQTNQGIPYPVEK